MESKKELFLVMIITRDPIVLIPRVLIYENTVEIIWSVCVIQTAPLSGKFHSQNVPLNVAQASFGDFRNVLRAKNTLPSQMIYV